ncbi:phage terminase large subunit [Priestia endophytica]
MALKLIRDLMKYPVSTLCVRKVARTLEESVFEQLKEAIDILGVETYWHVNKSPLKLTYLPRGNNIICRGVDDPAKIKSIKVSKYPVAFLRIEELAEFRTEDKYRTLRTRFYVPNCPMVFFMPSITLTIHQNESNTIT